MTKTYVKHENGTVDLIGFAHYAKVFDKQGQFGDIDRGNATSEKKWLRELAKSPEAKLDFVFSSDEDVADLLADKDFENDVTNPQTSAVTQRVKDVENLDYGVGKLLKFKVKQSDMKEYVDRKTKEVKEFEAGGLPTVKIAVAKDDAGVVTDWADYEYDDLGSIGNGSLIKLRFEPKYLRPKLIGVIDLVEYTDGGTGSEGQF